MASWKNQKPIPLQTASAKASVPGVNPDESTADSQLISHDASMSAAMTSPAGSSGPPPAASAVAADRSRLQADLGARLLPCLLDGLLANIQGAFFTRAFEGFLARLIQRLVTSILTTRDVKATSNTENVLGSLAYCSFDVTAWVV